MYLDKESKRMLDRLIAGGPGGPQRVYTYEYLEQTFGYAEDETRRILKGLADKALVELAYYSSGAIAGASLTQGGKAYKEIRRMEERDKWLERLYGFIAGVAVSVLVAFIRNKLQL